MQINRSGIGQIMSMKFAADDLHVHFRDGKRLESVAGFTAKQFNRALVMPNLKPPVRSVAEAIAYRDRIIAVTGDEFEPLMTLYLTGKTSYEDILAITENPGVVHAIKCYPAGGTTNSESGVSNIRDMELFLHHMETNNIVLSLHGEIADSEVDVFDREEAFLADFFFLRTKFPKLRMVLEHVTTKEAVRAVQLMHAANPGFTAATITPQHLLANRNDMLGKGGIRPHHYCMPILKREEDRLALLDAATSGIPCFFLGTDTAPHGKFEKQNDCGCAGCFTGIHALELYAEAFDSVDKLAMLPDFAGKFGASFYGIGSPTKEVTLIRKEWQIPEEIPFEDDKPLVPFWAGKTLQWKVAD